MNFIKFTNDLKTKENKSLVEAIQSGYRALHEAEEKVYTRQDGSTHATAYVNSMSDVNWEAMRLDFQELEDMFQNEDVEYNGVSMIDDIISKYIKRNQYAGSADWGGASIYSFEYPTDNPGFEGLYVGEFDHAWVVGIRKLDDEGDIMSEDIVLGEIELDESPMSIFNTIYSSLIEYYNK